MKKIWQFLRKTYFSYFEHYTILETKVFDASEADKLLRENVGKAEEDQWILSSADKFFNFPQVCLERRKRITK